MASDEEDPVVITPIKTYSREREPYFSRSPNVQHKPNSLKTVINSDSFYDRTPNKRLATSDSEITILPSNSSPKSFSASPTSNKTDKTDKTIFRLPSVSIGSVNDSIPLTVGNLSENERVFNARIINYPEGAQVRDQVSINGSDLDCLNPCKMLNDNIVYLYLKYLTLEEIKECHRKKIHLFNTFFYSKLKQLKKTTDDIRRWIKDVEIFSTDFLVIPICDQTHWFLIIVCYAGEVPTRNDPITIHDDPEHWNPQTDDPRVPAIIILDSLGRKNRRTCTNYVREFLKYESDKITDNSPREFSRETIKDVYAKVPTQSNSYDCGIYILQYFEEFFKNPVANYIRMYQNKDMSDWFNSWTIIHKRSKIRDLIDKKRCEQPNKVDKSVVIK